MVNRRQFLTGAITAAVGAPALAGCTTPSDGRVPSNSAGTGLKGTGLTLTSRKRVAQLHALNLDWFYTWGHSLPRASPIPGFVPMVWGASRVRRDVLNEVDDQKDRGQTENLLGFNEPDLRGQADLSPAEALRSWSKLQKTGLRLGSPAPVNAMGDWMKTFMEGVSAKDLSVDFVCVHAYLPPKADGFLRHIEEVHEYYGKPVWVTEYAVADWEATTKQPTRYSGKEIRSFMEETVMALRAMDYVERFAWKTRPTGDPIMGESALFHDDGDLTETGELYRSL